MINNLADYFKKDYRYYLNSISYNRIEEKQEDLHKEKRLSCASTISTEVYSQDKTLKLTLEETLSFDPQSFFSLTVSFCAILNFNEDNFSDYEWEKIDISKEFDLNGSFVLHDLKSRISLLFAQITAAFGKTPIIIPTVAMVDKD